MKKKSLPADDACHAQELAMIERLSALPDRPAAMAAFDAYFRDDQRRHELSGPDRPKVVGQLCHFVPAELVWAAGAVLLWLDSGCVSRARAGERLVSADCCCAVRAAAGLDPERFPLAAVDLLVVPASCDAKMKLGALLAERPGIATFPLRLPRSHRGAEIRRQWLLEIEALVARLEKLTGRRLTARALREAIGLRNREVALIRRIQELRRAPRLPIGGADALLVAQASHTADPRWWLERAGLLVAECEERVRRGQGLSTRARLLLTGSPVLWPDFKLLTLLSECQAEVVADETCSGTEPLSHPTVVDEGTRGSLVRAAAERVLLPCNCPCFLETEGRLDRLVEQAARSGAAGVVHHLLRLCQPYAMDALALGRSLREHRLPTLEITAELGQEDAARLRNRIEAFVEMLQAPGTP